jgi:hypothetical protein
MSYGTWDCDPADVYAETVRRARKPHSCAACRETIATGHRYTDVRIIFEGRVDTIKRCLRCQAIHEHLRDLGDGESWPEERLDCGQSYESEWGECPDEIAALAFALPGEADS